MIVSEWFTKPMFIAQTVWSGVQYSLLSEDDKQCHPFVYCKEFILDVVWSTINNERVDVYGFDYRPSLCPPATLSKSRLMLRNKDDNRFKSRLVNAMKFLHQLEAELGFELSEIEPVENAEKSPTFLLSSSKDWMQAPPMLSLLTLMVRIAMIYDGETPIWDHCKKICNRQIKAYQLRDDDHLNRSIKTIKTLVVNNTPFGRSRFNADMKKNWPHVKDSWAIHDLGGIVSLASGASKRICPSWYPPLEEKKCISI